MSNKMLSRPLGLVWYLAGTLWESGGGERLILEGLKYFKGKGIQARLVLNEPIPASTNLFDGAYASVISVSVVEGFQNLTRDGNFSILNKYQRQVARSHLLLDTILSYHPDVIIANSQSECYFLWLASLLTRREIPNYVTFIHGSPYQFAENPTKYTLIHRKRFKEIWEADPVYREMIPSRMPPVPFSNRIRMEAVTFLTYLALRKSKFVFTHSEKNCKEIGLLYDYQNAKVVSAGGYSQAEISHRHCQDMKSLYDLDQNKVIFSVCRLITKKRVDLTVRAFSKLVKKDPAGNYILVVGGTGPHEAHLRALSKELNIEDQVRFIGYIPEEQLRDWYASCDAYVSTDNADHDLSVAMAWPIGCKVVITSQYSVPDVLKKMRRFIFQADPDDEELAGALYSAVQAEVAPVDREDLEEINALTWEHYFEEILRYIELSR